MKIKTIQESLSQAELLAMLAEEAAELSQAALKLRRVLTGTNPTPVSANEAVQRLIEEIADVDLCEEQISCIDWDRAAEIHKQKHARWLARLMEAEVKQ